MSTNDLILNKIHSVGTNAYQQRIPLATKNNIAEVYETLTSPENAIYWNEFAHNLINVIGTFAIRDYDWQNPLKELKNADLSRGLTIEEIAVGLVKASGYNPEDNNIFKRSKAEVHAVFHTLNDKRRYDITINRFELQRAFNSENGLSELVVRLLSVPVKSSEYDEFQIMKEVIAVSNDAFPIYNIQSVIDDITNPTADELKTLSYNLRVAAKRLALAPTGLYNAKGVPTVSRTQDLVIFTTPEIVSALDVNVLADAFNVSRTDFVNKIIELDELPVTGHALLVDKNWFVSGDYVNEITSFFNPKSLEENYYLHQWSLYSTSPFANAVVFSNSATTNVPTVTVTIEGISGSFYDEDNNVVTTVSSDSNANLVVVPTGTIVPETPDFIVPGEYTTKITGFKEVTVPPVGDPGDEPTIKLVAVKLGTKTYVDSRGRLRVSDTVPAGTKLSVEINSAYINPETGVKSDLTDTVILTVA